MVKQTKPIDLHALSDKQLGNLVANYRKHALTDHPVFLEALAQIEKRMGHGLNFDTSFALIMTAARERQFLSYKALADGSGGSWSKVHYAIGGHLWRLVEYGHKRGWPMVSAIVVNAKNVASGEMAPDTLKGFIAAARALGHPVTDEMKFLREQQDEVFAKAAKMGAGNTGDPPAGPGAPQFGLFAEGEDR